MKEKKKKEAAQLTDKITELQTVSKKQTKELKAIAKFERQQKAADDTIFSLRNAIQELNDAHSQDAEAIRAAHAKVASQVSRILSS